MPLGLWKSRWEIYREETKARGEEYRAEMRERDAKRDDEAKQHQERMERFSEEAREERAAAEGRWLKLSEEASESREKFDRELAEARHFNRQMLTQLETTYANLSANLQMMGERIETNTEEVKAQTNAIMLLLDHFRGPNGGPPV
jgi:hypothetical protein